TNTGPSKASAVSVGKTGTVTVSAVVLVVLMVALTGLLPGPVNVTTGAAPKLLPLMVTVLPRSPDDGTRLEMTGGVAVPLGVVFAASPWEGRGCGLPTSTMVAALMPVPVSGLVTLILNDPDTPSATSTRAPRVLTARKDSSVSVMPGATVVPSASVNRMPM